MLSQKVKVIPLQEMINLPVNMSIPGLERHHHNNYIKNYQNQTYGVRAAAYTSELTEPHIGTTLDSERQLRYTALESERQLRLGSTSNTSYRLRESFQIIKIPAEGRLTLESNPRLNLYMISRADLERGELSVSKYHFTYFSLMNIYNIWRAKSQCLVSAKVFL